jgi:hypothetical protein
MTNRVMQQPLQPEPHAKRQPPTPEQVIAERKRQAEKDTHKAALADNPIPTLPAVPTASNAVATPRNRQEYLDEIAPASIVGRMIKSSKDHMFVTADDGAKIDDDVDFVALCDQTMFGLMKFDRNGGPPERHMGLLYEGFVMPNRATLGDLDRAEWELGLDGKPQDPWQHFIYLVLQRGDTGELFTYTTSSVTGRRAVGNLLRHYDRDQKTHPETYPIVRLKVGGFQHRDDRVGWVNVPVLAVMGRTPKDGVAQPDGSRGPPDSSLAADMDDQIPTFDNE